MNSKPVLFLLVLGLLGLVAGCEPAGPKDVKLTAPPGAVSPRLSDAKKVHRLTYTIASSEPARAHAVEELGAQGFVRCENGQFTAWGPYTAERDGKRVSTMRQQELMFRREPPRIASIELVRQEKDIAVTVAVEQLLTGEVIDTQRARFCAALPTR
jgi:hypothetical protein